MDFDDADPVLVEAVRSLLVEHGPATEAELLTALAAERVACDSGELKLILEADLTLAVQLGDRWIWLPAVIQDRVFTHRVTAPEIEHDMLAIAGDLDLISWLLEDENYQQLSDGRQLEQALSEGDSAVLEERIPAELLPDGGALVLPVHQLAGLRPGDLVGMRFTGTAFSLEDVPVPPLPAPEALSRALARYLPDPEAIPEIISIIAAEACVLAPEAFRDPTAPLTELLDDAGFSRNGEWVAPPGYDFDRADVEGRLTSLARQHDLTEDEALAALTVISLYDQVRQVFITLSTSVAEHGEEALSGLPEDVEPPGDRVVVRTALDFLSEPTVTQAVYLEIEDPHEAAALGLFAETFERQAPRPARPALRWLQGKAFEQLGSLPEAEAAFETAETMDPDWSLALIDLARMAGDRGDATRGLALLRRAGADTSHALAEMLYRYQPAPRADLGRNQPCWCGSGRKYKHCHLRDATQSLDTRASWLYDKATYHLREQNWTGPLIDTAEARTPEGDKYALIAALEDPLVIDTLLFEGGALAAFLDARGELLPEDELALARRWLSRPRSLYDVQSADTTGVMLRDIRSGESFTVQDSPGPVRNGAVICAHLLPVEDRHRIFGGVHPVEPGRRDGVLELLDSEADPVAICAYLSA